MSKKFLAGLLSLVLAAPADAAVTVVRTVVTDGIAGFGASTKHMTTWIAGDKHREESKGEGKPSMMERMAGVGRPVITRLDKKVVWTLNEPKKRYEETPLVPPQPTESSDSSSSDSDADRPQEKPTTRITQAEFKVTPLGQKKTFGAYVCDGYQLNAFIEMEDLETKKRSKMRMVNTMWNAPESGAVAQLKKEEADYLKAYAKTLGMTDAVRKDLAALGTAMIAGMAGAGEKELSGALAKMPAELKKVKGYPIYTRVEWYTENGDDGAADGDEPADQVEIPTSVGDALGGFAAGLAKKKMAPKKPVTNENGRLVMGMSSEIKSISTAAIPAGTFEVPAGFKKAH